MMLELFTFGAAIALLVTWFFISYYRNRKRVNKLIQYFHGLCSKPMGDALFTYRGYEFRLARIARGGGQTGVGGSYPVLSTYLDSNSGSMTKSFSKVLVGHAESGRYTRGRFLILPPHSLEDIAGKKYLFGSDDDRTLDLFKRRKMEPVLGAVVASLFREKYHHLSIGPEVHVSGLGLRKKRVLSYIGLPEQIYDYPEALLPYLDSLIAFCAFLDISAETYHSGDRPLA